MAWEACVMKHAVYPARIVDVYCISIQESSRYVGGGWFITEHIYRMIYRISCWMHRQREELDG